MSVHVDYVKLIFHTWDICDTSHIHASYPSDIHNVTRLNQPHLASNFDIFSF